MLVSVRVTALAVILTCSAVARAEEPASDVPPSVPRDAEAAATETRPGVLNEAAALPRRYDGYVNVAGGATTNGRSGFGGAMEAAALWSFARRFAAGAGGATVPPLEGERTFTPWVAAYAQILSQAEAGFDLTTSVRYRTLGPELAGSQLSGRLNAGRSFGSTYVAINGSVGQGLGSRGDVDFEGGSLFYVRVARIVRLGSEARVRGEVVDRYATAEDEGRPVEILAGGVAGVELRPLLVQALAGWSWPRGPLPSAPAALGAASFSF